MLIENIIPYAFNARRNDKAIPAVAESIKEFGLRGQIILESRENPTIVAGHTRVRACKLLGWTEIPDKHIAFCEDLTEEQIKAYRLADNRTAEIATWNTALLKREIGQLRSIRMERFGFDFKSKEKNYGSERLRTDKFYNLDIVNAVHCGGAEDMPVLEAVDYTPRGLLGFNYCKNAKETDYANTVHFFIDDYQFERLWNKPKEYIELLAKFDAVLTPDFSLYMDMPLPMQRWNEYRRRALGNYWQRLGLIVIPTLSWTDERSYEFCFGGLPQNGTYAVSTVGVMRNDEALKTFREGLRAAVRALKPKRLICYGAEADMPLECDVVHFSANTAFKE